MLYYTRGETERDVLIIGRLSRRACPERMRRTKEASRKNGHSGNDR